MYKYLKSQSKEVFPDVPSTGLKKKKNLKYNFVRAVLPDINEEGRCEQCGGKRPPCQLCSYMKNAKVNIQMELIK